MNLVKIALANIRSPQSPTQAVAKVLESIRAAAAKGARVVCFPECYVPGYRLPNKPVPAVDDAFLEKAWSDIAASAAAGHIGVILGTERIVGGNLRISTLVVDDGGTILGFQDKVQLDPSEESTFEPGETRQVFKIEPLTFGIVICHEGFRYPETVRWAVQNGAQVVFHPHFAEAEPSGYRPAKFADPANSFHEKAAFCRAAENTCYFATVNCASAGSPTTSAVVAPDGALIASQPYGEEGLLIVDLDLGKATGLLAKRFEQPLGFNPTQVKLK